MTKYEMLLFKAIEEYFLYITDHPHKNNTVIALLKYFLLNEEKYVGDNKEWFRVVRFDEGFEQLAKELNCDRKEVLQALFFLERGIGFKYGRGYSSHRFLTFEHGENGKPLKITLFLITEHRDMILKVMA